jgi:hypothetical protein
MTWMKLKLIILWQEHSTPKDLKAAIPTKYVFKLQMATIFLPRRRFLQMVLVE